MKDYKDAKVHYEKYKDGDEWFYVVESIEVCGCKFEVNHDHMRFHLEEAIRSAEEIE